jgi:hypothetical protein
MNLNIIKKHYLDNDKFPIFIEVKKGAVNGRYYIPTALNEYWSVWVNNCAENWNMYEEDAYKLAKKIANQLSINNIESEIH